MVTTMNSDSLDVDSRGTKKGAGRGRRLSRDRCVCGGAGGPHRPACSRLSPADGAEAGVGPPEAARCLPAAVTPLTGAEAGIRGRAPRCGPAAVKRSLTINNNNPLSAS